MKLIYGGAEILKKKMPEYIGDFSDVQKIIHGMHKILKKFKGIGLAAPQVGLEMNLFIMYDATTAIPETTVINPIIVYESREFEVDFEGCLSFPNEYPKIKRPKQITTSYYNEHGILIQKDFHGIWARCFMHEYDHLNGITFDDIPNRLRNGNQL